jgi:hypothetical protein
MHSSFLDAYYMPILLDFNILIVFAEESKIRHSSFCKVIYRLKNQISSEKGAGTAESV